MIFFLSKTFLINEVFSFVNNDSSELDF